MNSCLHKAQCDITASWIFLSDDPHALDDDDDDDDRECVVCNEIVIHLYLSLLLLSIIVHRHMSHSSQHLSLPIHTRSVRIYLGALAPMKIKS